MKIKSVELVMSAGFMSQCPPDSMPEIALVGRSNVGKSTLINSMLQRKSLARTSGTPGKTQTLNFYKINERFHLVDLPGYGYAALGKGKLQSISLLMQDIFSPTSPVKLGRAVGGQPPRAIGFGSRNDRVFATLQPAFHRGRYEKR
jgi:GTP-binding protein